MFEQDYLDYVSLPTSLYTKIESDVADLFMNLNIRKYNSALSNKSFKEKKERKDNNGNPIGYLNGLNLNADLVDKDTWTVDLIKARTNKLVGEILELFKL